MVDVTIIALNLDENLDIKGLVDYVSKTFISPKIFVASKKQTRIKNDILENYVFENCTNDEALNSMIKDVQSDKLIIVRNVTDYEDISKVFSGLKKSNQVCVLKKPSNKIKAFFEDMTDYVTQFLLGYKFLHASIGVVGFSKDVVAVLKSLRDCSIYTKMDKWIGIEIVKVETKNPPKVKFQPKIMPDLIKISLFTLIALAPLLCWIFIDTIQKSIILQLLFAFIIILFVCLTIIQIILLCVKLKIGNNTHKVGEIKIKRRKNGKSKNSN